MNKVKQTIKMCARSEWIYWFYSKCKTNLQRYIDATFEANQIIDNLWLGALKSSCNREALKERNIETIVSAILGASAIFPFDFNYERAKLRDVEYEDIKCEFERLLPEIHKDIINKRGVLVHCVEGRSRSVAIVAAYLIKYKRMTTDQSLAFIKEKRTQIDPNPGYIKQLREYEETLNLERNNKKNI